jgi:hypothetical protein
VAERKGKVSEDEEAVAATGDSAKTADRARLKPQAAPMAAPQPKVDKKPEPTMSTAPNAVAPNAPLRDDHTKLMDDKGQLCTPEGCLDHPGPDDPRILVTVTKRIYREYRHPHTTTKVTKLLYPVGAMITKSEAARLKAEMLQDRVEQTQEEARKG